MAKLAPQKLKSWRVSHSFTHEAAGAHFGTTRMTWFRWETGVVVPTPMFMVELYRQGVAVPNDFYDLPELPRAKDAA